MIFHDFLSKILGDPAKFKALKFLIKQRLGITGRSLARVIGVSHSKTNHMLKELVVQGVIIMHGQGHAHVYQVNKEHFLIEKIRPLLELEINIFDILGEQLYSPLDQKPLSIILHGSIARGDERPDSDIDTVFVFDDDVYHEGIMDEIVEKCFDISSKFGNILSVIPFPLSRFLGGMREKEPFVREVVKDGRVIHGLTISELINYGRTKDQNG